MIFYFSGTGNSLFVAKKLSSLINDDIYDITKINGNIDLLKEDRIGIIFPIHAWGVPLIVLDFLKTIDTTNIKYKYAIATCGEDCGDAFKKIKKYFKYNSAYSIELPNNYLIGSDLENDDIVYKKFKKADLKIEKIKLDILSNKESYDVHKGSLKFLKSSIVNKAFNKFARRTKPFFVTDKCISCSFCKNNCPSKSIEMKNNVPIWINKNCYMCLKCINQCPAMAIEYGKKTKNRKRYNINNLKI